MSGAPLSVRAADPRQDLPRVHAVLSRNLPQAAPPERLEWLYLGNPLGPSLLWLVEEESTGEAVGTSAAHLRRFRLDGREVTVLNLSDFAIDARYRTLGPALSLLRATLQGVRARGCAFSYDLPSESMRALYRRLGCVELGAMQRLVRPLSLVPALRRRLGPAGALLGHLADPLLRLRDAGGGKAPGLDVAPLEGGFGEEFDRFDAGAAGQCRARGVRSAAYLRWRFGGHTMWPHQTLVARRGTELAGYLVWRETEPSILSVAELECAGDPAAARALVGALAAGGRRAGAAALSVTALAGGPAAALFTDLGFALRGEGPGPLLHGADAFPDARDWWFLEGDRDI